MPVVPPNPNAVVAAGALVVPDGPGCPNPKVVFTAGVEVGVDEPPNAPVAPNPPPPPNGFTGVDVPDPVPVDAPPISKAQNR